MKKTACYLKPLLVACLYSFSISISHAQTDSKKNAKEADMTTKEKVVSAERLGEAKLKIDPKGPKPEWAPKMKDEMLAVLEKFQSYNAPSLTTLSAEEARKQPTMTTAVLDLIKENDISLPESKVDTSGQDIPVEGGNIHLRLYTPKEGNGPFPVVVYYHGGGWVIANLDTYHASAKALAEMTGAIVVSVGYRQAPEHKFPTAHSDCFTAYSWVLKNAASIKGDPTQVAVAGESAGGHLACAVSIMALEKQVKMPIHQLLVYPIVGTDTSTESYTKYANAVPLNKPLMQWFFKQYTMLPSDLRSPYLNLLKNELKGLPTTTIITAQLDPLASEGKLLAEKLEAAGVKVVYKEFEGVTHEFFGMGAILPSAQMAEMLAAERIKGSFAKKNSKQVVQKPANTPKSTRN